MGKTLIITEKPSVAQDIARALNVKSKVKNDGYIENEKYVITWCIGAMLEIASPDEMDEKYKKWNIESLPIIFNEYKKNPIKTVKPQLNIIKKLMNRNDIVEIIDAGDIGAKGCEIQEDVRIYSGIDYIDKEGNIYNKKMVKRLHLESMTEKAILNGMSNLRNIRDYDNYYKSSNTRSISDYIVGMTFSRLFSCKYPIGKVLSCGRVQTPTLALVVERFIQLNNFEPTNYYEIEGYFNGMRTIWFNNKGSKFSKKDEAERIYKKVIDKDGEVFSIETKKKINKRPQLYDLTELQREANRLYGYSSDDVLKIAQSLYETHKLTTYPRTDSRYITVELAENLESLVEKIKNISEYKTSVEKILRDGLNIDERVANNSKISDHHALLCTENIDKYDLNKLSKKEKNILHLIITRMLVVLSEDYVFNETELIIKAEDELFKAIGKMTVKSGWREINDNLLKNLENKDNEKEQVFKNVSQGEILKQDKISILTKQTTAPKLHTEGTLLSAMEKASNTINDDESLKNAIKEKGLGTPATRSAIIETLFKRGYMQRVGKAKAPYIAPTKLGFQFIMKLKKDAPKIISPKFSAEWEYLLELIEKGKLEPEKFISGINNYVTEIVNNNKEIDTSFKTEIIEEKEEIGKCPRCGSSVYESEKTFYCSAFKNEPKCLFTLWKDDKFLKKVLGKRLSKSQAKNLLEKGYFKAKCKNSNGKEYKAIFKIEDDGNVKYKMEFE